MTVSAQTPINRSTANGATTVFPYTFKILAEGDIEVSDDGIVKTLTTDYTVSGVGDEGGGNVTMLVAPLSAHTVVRRRVMALTRDVDYQDQGELPTDTLDSDQDAPVLMIQQLQEQLDRAVLVTPESGEDPDDLMAELLDARDDAVDAAAAAATSAAEAGASAAVVASLAASDGSSLVGFIQSGTGAVPRTVQAKLREVELSVTDYGAVGDGVTNCRAGVVAALAEAASIGGRVTFPPTPNSYYIDLTDGSITVPSNVSMVGFGQRSKITIDTTSLVPLFDCSTNDDIQFDGLHLVGNLPTQGSVGSGSCAISAAPGASNISVNDCIATDWTKHVFDLDGVDGLVVSGNRVERTWRGSGILIGNTTASTDVIVTDNLVLNTQQANIQAYVGAGRMVITGNICDGTDAGVTVAGGGTTADNITAYAEDINGVTREAIVANNICRNSGNHGMHIGGDGVVIQGNSVFSPAEAGIFVSKGDNTTPDPATGAVVAGNYVEFEAPLGTTPRGIIVRNMTGFSVTGNVIKGAQDAIEINGIDTAGVGCREGTVSGNILVGYTRYGVWLRNRVQQVLVTANSMSASGGAGTDIREDLVSAASVDNWVCGNPSSGATSIYAQIYRSTDNNILQFGNRNGVHLRVGSSTANVVNYFIAAGNAAGAAPILSAAGADTNIDLFLAAKGTGVVRFGTHTVNADAAITGYILVKDSAGTNRKLAIIA